MTSKPHADARNQIRRPPFSRNVLMQPQPYFRFLDCAWRLVTVPSKVRNVFPDRSGRNFATRVDVGHSFLPGFRVRDGEVNGVPFSNVT
jgi:hypothetical protein